MPKCEEMKRERNYRMNNSVGPRNQKTTKRAKAAVADMQKYSVKSGLNRMMLNEINKEITIVRKGRNTTIKNSRQLKYTKKKLRGLEESLKVIRKKYASDKNKIALLSQGYVEHVTQLKNEINEYEKPYAKLEALARREKGEEKRVTKKFIDKLKSG